MKRTIKLSALILALIMLMSAFAGCAKTETKIETDTAVETKASDELYFTQQEVRPSLQQVLLLPLLIPASA